MTIFTSHGGRSNEGRVQVDGLNVGAAFNGGGVSGYIMDTAGAQELQFTLSGGLGEAETGGINLNIVPKTGGNRFSGEFFGSAAGKWSQATTSTTALRASASPRPASSRTGTSTDPWAGRSSATSCGSMRTPRFRHASRGSRRVWEPERRRCDEMDLRGRSQPGDSERRRGDARIDPAHRAGLAAKQGRLLHRPAAAVHGKRARQRW